jgi:hypothetical protein
VAHRPVARTIEVYELTKGKRVTVMNASDEDVVQAPPFESIRLRLLDLWI